MLNTIQRSKKYSSTAYYTCTDSNCNTQRHSRDDAKRNPNNTRATPCTHERLDKNNGQVLHSATANLCLHESGGGFVPAIAPVARLPYATPRQETKEQAASETVAHQHNADEKLTFLVYG
jgi:hypothetical protein